MNDETKKAMDALAGNGGTDAAATDWKAKCEELQRQLNSARVDEGRVKKLDEKNKALERELAEARASRRVQSVIDDLPEDVRSSNPDESLKGAAIIAQRMTEQTLASRDEELAALKAQIAEREQREQAANQSRFTARIEQEFPGFLASAVAEGGANHAAWVQYQRFNAPSIQAAARSFDFDTLAYHIRQFYMSGLGIEPPSGGKAPAAPDPGNIGGGQPVVVKPGKTYTWDEIDKLYDEIEELRSRGDKAGMRRLADEIEQAQREGRVK